MCRFVNTDTNTHTHTRSNELTSNWIISSPAKAIAADSESFVSFRLPRLPRRTYMYVDIDDAGDDCCLFPALSFRVIDVRFLAMSAVAVAAQVAVSRSLMEWIIKLEILSSSHEIASTWKQQLSNKMEGGIQPFFLSLSQLVCQSDSSSRQRATTWKSSEPSTFELILFMTYRLYHCSISVLISTDTDILVYITRRALDRV